MYEHVDPIACADKTASHIVDEIGHAEWRGIRDSAGLSLAELAVLLGVDAGSISRWESGKRRPTNPEYFRWLRDRDLEDTRIVERDVFWLLMKRGGWIAKLGREPLSLARPLWDAMWKVGGLYDRWRGTGTLPHFTPADASS
jgi:transcriptional regulator with XRE-family HTH domain